VLQFCQLAEFHLAGRLRAVDDEARTLVPREVLAGLAEGVNYCELSAG